MNIPNILIERLSGFGPRLIKVEAPAKGDPKSGKRAVEHGFQLNPYGSDSQTINDWVKGGGNYGVLMGETLITIDLENSKDAEGFPKTFTVGSGSGKGRHLYFRSNCTENGVVSKENEGKSEHIGDIQANLKYVVGPGSRHHSGGTYEIIHDGEIAYISQVRIEEILKSRGLTVSWARKLYEDTEAEAKEEDQIIEQPMENFVNIKELTQIGPFEYQGSHPIHGSTTGQNFTVDTSRSIWHCFRCNSGGGVFSWIAVKEGLIQCHEAKPGLLRGEKFKGIIKALKKLGYKPKSNRPEDATKRFFGGKFGKEFIPSRLGDELLEEMPIITTPGPMIYTYDREIGVYEPNGEAWIKKRATEILGEAFRNARVADTVRYIENRTLTRNLPSSNPELLVCENGVLSVLTGEFGPFTHDKFIITRIPARYDPEASKAAMEKFVSEVTVSERDAQTLKEYSGYCLYRSYKIAKALLLVGETRTGKSTFIELVTSMLGEDNVSHIPFQEIDGKFAAARLYGKLGNFYADIGSGAIKDTGKFKAITGDDQIDGEFKFKNSFHFRNYAKLIYSCNKIPDVDEKEPDAFFNRWILVAFPFQFIGDRENPNLKAELTTPESLSGMLNWSLEGLRDLMKRKRFEESGSSEEARERYFMSKDPMEYFFEQMVRECGEEECVGKEELYEAYHTWCVEGRLPFESRTTFNKAVRLRWPFKREVTPLIEGRRVKSWAGLKIGTEDTEGTKGTIDV